MRVLGIDPGSRLTGFGVVNVMRSGKMHYISSGCVRVTGDSLSQRLRVIYEGVDEVIDTYQPDVLAVEKVFMARE